MVVRCFSFGEGMVSEVMENEAWWDLDLDWYGAVLTLVSWFMLSSMVLVIVGL